MRMREILIDITRLLGRIGLNKRLPTGVDRVSLAYIKHYAHRARAVIRLGFRNLVLGSEASQIVFNQLLEPDPHFNRLVLWQLVRTSWNCPRLDHKILFNTGHSGLENSGHLEKFKKSGVTPVFLVHDLIPISHPEYCRVGELNRHQKRMATVFQIGAGLIANSNATLQALQAYAGKMGWLMPPSIVSHLAPPSLPEPGTNPVGMPYFVMLGTIEPRKNHWMILQVWRQLIEKMGKQAPQLVIIGQRGWECENVIDLLERGEHVREHVRELPDCSDYELSSYLAHAQALLFPSFAEGYGLPLVESLSLGTPVIASDLAVFREIAGVIPEYLDPLDGMGWREMIEAYVNPVADKRVAQIKRIQGFMPPTWDDHFKRVDVFLETLN